MPERVSGASPLVPEREREIIEGRGPDTTPDHAGWPERLDADPGDSVAITNYRGAVVRTSLGRFNAWGKRYWRVLLAAGCVLALVAGVWLAATPSRPVVAAAAVPPPQRVLPGTTLKAKLCGRPVAHPFVPATITMPGITDRAPVLALGRLAHRQPMAPPVNETGKHEFAWTDDTPRPGSAKGNTLLNAHTWPWTSTPALGNLMIKRLRPGDLIVVRGQGQRLCYRVTKQEEVGVDEYYPDYEQFDGPPQLAFMVCSGTRLGPGDWNKRMVWYAAPVT